MEMAHVLRFSDRGSRAAPTLHPAFGSSYSPAPSLSTPDPSHPCPGRLRGSCRSRKAGWLAISQVSPTVAAGSCLGSTIGMSSLSGRVDVGGGYRQTLQSVSIGGDE